MELKGTLLYDGDCGICDEGMSRMRQRMNPPVKISAYQSEDLQSLGVPERVVAWEGPVLVRPGDAYLVGPAAIAEVMKMSGRPYETVGKAMNAPGARQFLRWIGPKMYRNRHHLPGAGEQCQLPVTQA